MKRSIAWCAGAVALAALITGAGPATADSATARAGICEPGPKVLPSLAASAGGAFATEGVHDLGPRRLAVGASGGLPVYWTGDRVHPVPLPAGYDEGVVRAVNRKGLMAGWLTRRSDRTVALFTFRRGDTAVRLLGEGGTSGQADIDVNDSGVVAAVDTDGTPKAWRGGRLLRTLALPPDSGPGTIVTRVTGINARGDVVGAAERSYESEEGFAFASFPVLWPADGGPARALPVARAEYLVHNLAEGVDDAGRVAGYVSVSDRFDPDHQPWVWTPPHADHGGSPGVLAGQREGTFEAVSPTTNVSVGTAMTHEEGAPLKPYQAQLWPGQGPVRALPSLAPDGSARARAVSDDDRVGGVAVDAAGTARPVVWGCASRQAYLS
ncbi:hypothetical protein [Streptomyces sp. NPDC053755]|uniref:hypothetical protein n=1 Tax=Streptomyces sp. NPDC053755 TaxID=3155815 RepID=UPI003433D887